MLTCCTLLDPRTLECTTALSEEEGQSSSRFVQRFRKSLTCWKLWKKLAVIVKFQVV